MNVLFRSYCRDLFERKKIFISVYLQIIIVPYNWLFINRYIMNVTKTCMLDILPLHYIVKLINYTNECFRSILKTVVCEVALKLSLIHSWR